jgi:hypothetical protein
MGPEPCFFSLIFFSSSQLSCFKPSPHYTTTVNLQMGRAAEPFFLALRDCYRMAET